MKKLYLHIGTHKTGSTSIQKTCFENHEKLLKLGYHYPTSIANLDGNHSILAWYFMGDERANDFNIEVFKKELEAVQAENVVISGEEFEFANSDAIAKIKEFFIGYEIVVLCYLRPQHELIRSEYIEWLKQGLTSDQFSVFWRLLSNLPRFNYEALYVKWSDCFDSVLMKSFVKAKELKFGVVEDFFNILGVDFDRFDIFKNSNVSPNSKVVSAWLLIAKLYELKEGKDFSVADYLYNRFRRSQREPLGGAFSNLSELSFLNNSTDKYIGFHGSEAKQCYSRFIDSNNLLFKLINEELWSDNQINFESHSPPEFSNEELKAITENYLTV